MNPIKDIMALKSGETLEVTVRLQDGSTRKLTAHRPDESEFVRFHSDKLPKVPWEHAYHGQRKGLETAKKQPQDSLYMPRYIAAAMAATLLLPGVTEEECRRIGKEWRDAYLHEMSIPELLQALLGDLPADGDDKGE